ncbi:MAG: stalk domain-containing protein, partial [Armatimonadota bacterium]
PQIEEQVESFHQLHGLFDVTKLCAILRHRGVKSPLLDAIARRHVRSVLRRDGNTMLAPYEGIGPKIVRGTAIVIGGGATAKNRVRESAFTHSAALGGLLEGRNSLVLEASLPLGKGSHPELLVSGALEDYGEGRFDECVAKCTRALEVDPEMTEGRIFRALARSAQGRPRQALLDLDRVVRDEPRMRGFRGVMKLHAGDPKAAVADVNAAAAAYPDDEAVWVWSGAVKAYTLDMPGALAAAKKLIALNPASEDAAQLLTVIQTLRRLDTETAQEYASAVVRAPFPFVEALVDGTAALQSMNFDTSVAELRRALRVAEENADNPGLRDFHARERALLMLAYAETSQGMINARMRDTLQDVMGDSDAFADDGNPLSGLERADQLIELHPDWATGYFAKAMCALLVRDQAPDIDSKALIDQGMARTGGRDPLLREWRLIYGEQSPGPTLYATGLLLALKDPGKTDPARYLRELGKEPGLTGRLARASTEFMEAASTLRGADLSDDDTARRHFQRLAQQDSLAGKAAQLALRADGLDGPDAAKLEEQAKELFHNTLRDDAAVAVRSRPTPDMASSIVYLQFLATYISLESNIGEVQRAVDAGHALLANLPMDAPTNETAQALGMVQFMAVGALGMANETQLHSDPQLNEAIAAIAQGRDETDRLRARAERLADDGLWAVQQRQSRFIYEFFKVFDLAGSAVKLQQCALREARDRCHEDDSLTEDRRDAILERISETEEGLEAEAEQRMKRVFGEGLYAMLAPTIQAADSVAELESLTLIMKTFDIMFQMIPGIAAQAGGDTGKLTDLLAQQAKLQHLMRAKMLKLSMADVLGPGSGQPRALSRAGRTFAPLRYVFEWLGAEVVYDRGRVIATRGNDEIVLEIGRRQATRNGERTTLASAPFVSRGVAYVPLRFVGEALGATVGYDAATRGVTLSSDGRTLTLPVGDLD